MKNISNKKLSFIVLLTACLGGLSNSASAVDGVILITQANAQAGNVTPGDTAGFPVTISRSGSYQLASNLTVPDENTSAIRIFADNVTLNLNGFAILGSNSCSIPNESVLCTKNGIGIGVSSTGFATTIINGSISGMGRNAINGGNSGLHVENMTIYSNGGSGVIGGFNGACIVTGNNISYNYGDGINTSPGMCTITNNTLSFNGSDATKAGIRTGSTGSTVLGNTINGNAGFGLSAENASTGYTNNVFFGNSNVIIGAGGQVSNGTQLGVDGNLCNGILCP